MTSYRPDSPIPFSGNRLDHCPTERSADQLQNFVESPDAQAILFFKGQIGIGKDEKPHRVHPSELIGQNLHAPGPIFLGVETDGPNKDQPLFAASLQTPDAFLPEQNFLSLRGAGARQSPKDLALIGYAKSLLDWHFTHRFCTACGGKTAGFDGGIKQKCTQCGVEHFPRINPVAIMLTTHQDKALLGRGIGWPPRYLSTLAGFVSPGENFEDTVYRETLEETGIRTTNIRYIFSQPWPFPAQLMLGARAEAINTDITIDTTELETARWVTKDEVAAAIEHQHPELILPPRHAISHQLLRHWLDEDP